MAMTKIEYLVNGTQVATIKEVCDLLGEKVTRKQVEAGEVPGVVAVKVDEDGNILENLTPNNNGTVEFPSGNVAELNDPLDKEDGEPTIGDTTGDSQDIDNDPENLDNDDMGEDNSSDDTDNEDTEEPKKGGISPELLAKMKALNDKKKAEQEASNTKTKAPKKGEPVEEYPEKGSFKTEKDMKKFYKNLSDEQLDEWLELEGLTDKVKLSDNEPINRMRKCMVLKDFHFPKQTSEKKKSKYADLTTEELLETCLDNDINVKDAKGNEKILRMYCIMALREAGLLE